MQNHIEEYILWLSLFSDGVKAGGIYLKEKYRTYYTLVSEHKDVVRAVVNLAADILELRRDFENLTNVSWTVFIVSFTFTICPLPLQSFKVYEHLWSEDREDQVIEFVNTKPLVADIRETFRMYDDRAIAIQNLPETYQIGIILIRTGEEKDRSNVIQPGICFSFF